MTGRGPRLSAGSRIVPTIWLIGFRGTGKTAVGRRLAAVTGLRFIDTDQCITEMEKKTIAEIFAERGEPHFRIAEQQVILRVATEEKNVVVAVGGGACGHEATVIAMRRSGPVVLLTASSDEIQRRLAGDPATAAQRPPLTDQEVRDEIVHLLHEREPDYRRAATLTIDTTFMTVEEVADAILKELRRRRH